MLALNSSVAMDGHRHDREHKVLAESSISVVLRGSVLSTEVPSSKQKGKFLDFPLKKLLSKLKVRNFLIWVKH